jgi:hypothetical protein
MRLWKLLGLAGIVGIATAGAVLARRRHWRHYDAGELRDQLHRRFAETVER